MTTYTFQSLFDFTRTTSGTFVGSNGLIQTTPASVNLLTFTQDFDNAAWTKTAATVTANIRHKHFSIFSRFTKRCWRGQDEIYCLRTLHILLSLLLL